MQKILFLLFCFFTIHGFSQNITVDDTQTAQQLIQNVLFNNSGCASISNFAVTGGNFGNSENSYAYFNGNNSTFPFDEGVVLSTGTANHTVGPNTSLSDDEGMAWGTDSDLNALFSDTLNATVLEFNFVPVTNYMSFEYIFASEEYQEGDNSTCNYSDVFAFLIKATTDTSYTNIAVIPNTTIPVQVTSVHPEIPGACAAENENYFGSWNNGTAPINFNGQTAVLKAESNVVAGQTYHIKLIIADHTNYRYDSAVFLKAGSFNIGTDLGIDILRSTGNALCGTENLLLDCNVAVANSYTWSVDTLPYDDIFTPLPGEITQTYNVTTEGRYKVEVDLGGTCVSEGIITVEYATIPTVFNTDLVSCNDDGTNFSIFNLQDANYDITNGDSSLSVINYYTNPTNPSTLITNFDTYTNIAQDQQIYAEVVNMEGCTNFAIITLKVFQNPTIKADESVMYCLNTFPDTIELEAGILGDATNYTYQWFYNNGIDPVQNLAQTTQQISINNIGVYTVEITNPDGCVLNRNITVNPSNTATITNILVSDTNFYPRVSILIEVIGEGDYEFAIDDYDFQDSNVFDNLLYGYHIITVKDKNGCLPNTQKEITLLDYAKFFTPNGDNAYDNWHIDNHNQLLQHFNTVSNITVFNRFGKIMTVFNPATEKWDGKTRNGNPAPDADYWFSVDLIDYNNVITTKRGHFSLKR